MITRAYLEREVAALEAEKRNLAAAGAALSEIDVTKHMAPVYLDLHRDIETGGHQFYNLPGGRGSCKSSFVSLEIVNGIMSDTTGNSNAIVFRRTANTMRESVYAQIAWAIDLLGVNALWRGGVSPMCYTYIPTGAQVIFRGLDDHSKLKSIKPRRGVFKYIWLEEFSELPGENFTRSVMQSVMRGGSNFVVFRSFNPPISINAWANIFIAQPDSRAITLLTNYTMIPPEWLGEDFIAEAERLKEINAKAYEHEYLGIATGSGGEVFPTVEGREITQQEIDNLRYYSFGLDFGFAADPAAFVCVGYDRWGETIYILDEIYKRHMSNSQMADAIKAKGYWDGSNQMRDRLLICDSAEPKSIYDLRTLGLPAKASYKRPNCVQYRTKWMQHRRIVIDPAKTPNAYREFVSYEYETDRDGNFIADLPDRDDHAISAVAYALEREIFQLSAGFNPA